MMILKAIPRTSEALPEYIDSFAASMSFSASSKTFNREDIPVGVGIRKPLFSKEDIGPINQAAVLHGKEDLSLSLKQNAVDLIISRVRSCRNLIIVSIGPLTNVATVLVKEPNLVRKSKLVMMGGVINSQQAEYNVSRDPEAARVVFESSMEVLMVGLDVTMKCQLRRQELDNLANKGLSSTELLMDMVRAWQESTGRTYPVLHDPLAVALAFDRALVKTESRKVNVETRGEFTRGFTIASKSKTPNAQVCLHVDATRFADLFMRILCSK
jgi:inosine-uridine nucleoside N-ribohydrolase